MGFYGVLVLSRLFPMLEDLKWYKQPRRSFQLINGQSCSSGWFQYFKYNYNLHPNVCSNSCEGWVEPKPRQMKYRLFAGVFFGAISRTSFWASSLLSCQWGSKFACWLSFRKSRTSRSCCFPRRLCAYGLRGFFNPYSSVREAKWLVKILVVILLVCCLIWLKKLLNCLAARTFVGMSSTLH